VNVLIDRHHAGLFHALQLLGDRLGWTVYTPIGHAWWDEAYWQFGVVFGDDRLAQQYLNPAQPSADPEYPDRPVLTVTLEQAKAMDWGVVMPTVQENQTGFARFASEHGAKYAYHVGNTNQQIDWTLDPALLNASEMPISGRGVQIGEEFDSDGMFRYRPPEPDSRRITSFVNCVPEMCVDQPYLGKDLEAIRTADFHMHGISGETGNLKPASAIRDCMAESAWAYHNKPQGDGYGHVLHYWAAIGRPLIGRGSHYKAKMGWRYWRDMETCIDLDLHPYAQVVEIIRNITPEQHEQMCRAIRAEFDKETNWAGDAQRVAELLA
jgi:hypothetical protein